MIERLVRRVIEYIVLGLAKSFFRRIVVEIERFIVLI
jgi:hypothetical protein